MWRKLRQLGPPALGFHRAAMPLPLRTAVKIGADEDFELSKATLRLHGYQLYTQIWDDQPPLDTFIITQLLTHVLGLVGLTDAKGVFEEGFGVERGGAREVAGRCRRGNGSGRGQRIPCDRRLCSAPGGSSCRGRRPRPCRRPPAQTGCSLARLPLRMGKNCLVPPHSGLNSIPLCLVGAKSNSPSPA